MENHLQPSAKEEIDTLIQERVRELVLKGEHERAASLLIERSRSQLADNHPSKNPGTTGVLEGEQVSMFANFEEQSAVAKDILAFTSAIALGGLNPETGIRNGVILSNFLMFENKYLLPAATKYLLESKETLDAGGKLRYASKADDELESARVDALPPA